MFIDLVYALFPFLRHKPLCTCSKKKNRRWLYPDISQNGAPPSGVIGAPTSPPNLPEI